MAGCTGKQKSDYQNFDDWSLERVAIITDQIGTALKQGDYDKLGGNTGSDDIEEAAGETLSTFNDDLPLIAARVTAFVFSTRSQSTVVATEENRKSVDQNLP